MTRYALALLFLITALAARAGDTDPGSLTDRAEARSLWQHPEWIKLLHYKVISPQSDPSYRTHVDDPRFFLSSRGASDPRAELIATLQGLFAPVDAADDHARCRFPARAAWLAHHLDFSLEALPSVSCPLFEEWRAVVQADEVTLIFPSYYLNSPSSMFGHTLLRLDPAQRPAGAEYLSFAVNFGAVVDAEDNSLFYAFKGLTGGYQGTFAVDQYYKKIQEYNRDENRDIWEYPLNLTAAETERMILHLWELREIAFDYYFFDENCSYRVLELLEVARPGIDLTSSFVLTAIPIDTVRAVADAGLITGDVYRPSRGSVLRSRLARLDAPAERLVWALSQDAAVLQDEAFLALPPDIQARVVEAAYKYLRYTQIGKPRDAGIAARSFALLSQIRQRAQWLEDGTNQADAPPPPHSSHASRRASLGIQRAADHNRALLGLRLSLHNLEEFASGFLPGAQINLGNFELAVDRDQDLDIERVDVVDIFSLSPYNRFFQPLSWRILTGLEPVYVNGRRHRAAHLSGGVGRSVEPWPDALLYALATARLESNRAFAHEVEIAGGAQFGLLQYFDGHAARVELGGEKFANGEPRARAAYRHVLPLTRHHALELGAVRRWQTEFADTEISLRYHYYY